MPPMTRAFRIGLNVPPLDPFWVEVREAAYQGAQRLGDELIPIYAPYPYRQEKPEEEIALVEEMLAQNLDAVIGWGFSTNMFARVLQANLAIIHTGSDVPLQHPRLVMREGLYPAAQLLASYVVERLDGRGYVLLIGGLMHSKVY